MQKLSLIYKAFLPSETPESLTHAASLQIFRLPGSAGSDYVNRLLSEFMKDAFAARAGA